jgi:integrase
VGVEAFLRFCIATGGQRPQQLLRATWGDYDLEQRRVRVVDAKGRGVPRVHLLPLTERAVEILEGVRPITGSYQWPFSVSGKSPVHLSSLKNAINRFLAANKVMPVFTARDLRRSCKQVAMKAGVAARWMNVLQGHEMGGLVGKHYANDPEAWLPERRQAMIAFDAMLGDVLSGKVTAKVIPLRSVAGDLAVQPQTLQ